MPCERGFSTQNNIMTKKRSALSVESLNNKCLIKAASDPYSLVEEAMDKFSKKQKTNAEAQE